MKKVVILRGISGSGKTTLRRPQLLSDAPNNCPIQERTADGVSVGRCWHFLGLEGDKICERHGNVTTQVAEYLRTGQLQEDPR